MRKEILVKPLDTPELMGAVDVFISVIGYETRSLFAATQFSSYASTKIALKFKERQVGSFSANLKWYEDKQFEVVDYVPLTFVQQLENLLMEAYRKNGADQTPLNLLIDISSMSRRMIAQIVHGLFISKAAQSINVNFVYAPSIYVPPDSEEIPVTISEPVIPEFSGWSTRPDLPASAILGLGYECGQALGTLEYLEPAAAWIFLPKGNDISFDKEVIRTNDGLLDVIEKSSIVPYMVSNPFECFCKMESLTFNLKQKSRPILIPFGPKIFALVSMLVGLIHGPGITVWRVSGEQTGEPTDRTPDGTIIGLYAQFQSIE
jgi:hypothetical protein